MIWPNRQHTIALNKIKRMNFCSEIQIIAFRNSSFRNTLLWFLMELYEFSIVYWLLTDETLLLLLLLLGICSCGWSGGAMSCSRVYAYAAIKFTLVETKLNYLKCAVKRKFKPSEPKRATTLALTFKCSIHEVFKN